MSGNEMVVALHSSERTVEEVHFSNNDKQQHSEEVFAEWFAELPNTELSNLYKIVILCRFSPCWDCTLLLTEFSNNTLTPKGIVLEYKFVEVYRKDALWSNDHIVASIYFMWKLTHGNFGVFSESELFEWGWKSEDLDLESCNSTYNDILMKGFTKIHRNPALKSLEVMEERLNPTQIGTFSDYQPVKFKDLRGEEFYIQINDDDHRSKIKEVARGGQQVFYVVTRLRPYNMYSREKYRLWSKHTEIIKLIDIEEAKLCEQSCNVLASVQYKSHAGDEIMLKDLKGGTVYLYATSGSLLKPLVFGKLYIFKAVKAVESTDCVGNVKLKTTSETKVMGSGPK